MNRTALIVLSLLVSACGDGGKLADMVGKLGTASAKDCASTSSVAATTPDQGATGQASGSTPDQKSSATASTQAQATDAATISPAVREAIRDAVREAVRDAVRETEKAAHSVAAEGGRVAAEATGDEPAPPLHRHRRGASQAVPVSAPRATAARTYDNHDNFSESTAPEEYRLPASGQILVPREGQSVLNGPNREGVAPPNSNPIRLSPNSGGSS
jgi:hypothetical protein